MPKKKAETLYICPGFEREPHQVPESGFYWNASEGMIRRSPQCRECSKARKRQYWREVYYPAHREAQIAATIRNRRKRKAQQDMSENSK